MLVPWRVISVHRSLLSGSTTKTGSVTKIIPLEPADQPS